MIMAQGLDSMSTNNLTHPVTQCTHVLHHEVQTRNLNQGASASSLIVGKTHSLHNMVGKCKYVSSPCVNSWLFSTD